MKLHFRDSIRNLQFQSKFYLLLQRRRYFLNISEERMYRYYIVRYAIASWHSAQEHCRHLGGQLYMMNTRDHWMTLMDNMINAGYSPDAIFLSHMIFTSIRPVNQVAVWISCLDLFPDILSSMKMCQIVFF